MDDFQAENMINHKQEIFSRPKKTWHISEKEKKLIADASKVTLSVDKWFMGVFNTFGFFSKNIFGCLWDYLDILS